MLTATEAWILRRKPLVKGHLLETEVKRVPTYIMLSTLTESGAETLLKNPARIREVNREIEAMGVKVQQQYAVLGPYDFVNIVEAPDSDTIARVSVELGARGSVRIITLTAIPIESFISRLQQR